MGYGPNVHFEILDGNLLVVVTQKHNVDIRESFEFNSWVSRSFTCDAGS